ncbi:60S ribosomal protein L32 [Mucor velutinosus]|uniref:60S ribosomal protein L32 n=1 Tax=Mucor velutinosus TaxID=708070 RepID=A0AAN7DGZ8_9FUNG|nr:60S ribosomal protein L32 [Mucor velutinosus]
MVEIEQSYLPLGKQLAANEKKTRDKAIRSLRKFLSTGSNLDEIELIKLWKGLFYCYWMSDKPLIQQALANDLGALVMEMPAANAIPFLKAFWQIHCQEWHGLDRIRLDKYYLLLRRVIYFSFQFLARESWDQVYLEAYTDMLIEGPLSPTDRKNPDAIRYHVIDLYFEELEKVLDDVRAKLEEADDLDVPMEEISRPLTVLAKEGSHKTLRNKAKEALKAHEMEMAAMAEDSGDEDEEALKQDDEDEEEEEEDEE